MKQHAIVRATGVIGIVIAYGIFVFATRMTGTVSVPPLGQVHPIALVIISIIVTVSPEVVNQLPFGPTRK